MENKIQTLLDKAMARIKSPSLKDATALARLAPIPAKLEQLQHQWIQMQSELNRIDAFLDEMDKASDEEPRTNEQTAKSRPRGPSIRRRRTKLHIEVDATVIGGQKMTISDHLASRSLTSFLALLYKLRGVDALEKLAGYRVNRAPLVSRNPYQDYRYVSGTGEAHYNYEPIADSGFFVLTTNTTTEKAEAIQGAWKALGLPIHKLTVKIIDKPDFLGGLN